ncbi:hypothetical protein ACYSNR_02585 [Enterococcus sp. LJL128]
MDSELYLLAYLDVYKLTDELKKIFKEQMQSVKSSEDEDGIYLSCSYFSMVIKKDDQSNIEFYEDEYGLMLDNRISIQLFHKTFYEGLAFLIEIFGKIAKRIGRNMLFIENGEYQVFRKKQDKVIINNMYDEYQVNYYTDDLFSKLDIPYTKKNLSDNSKGE